MYFIMTCTTSVVVKSGLYILKDLFCQLYGDFKRMSVDIMKEKIYVVKRKVIVY